jgi:hypothetical protein
LAAIEEAVATYRELTARWPGVYQQELDQSVVVLARLKNVGHETP